MSLFRQSVGEQKIGGELEQGKFPREGSRGLALGTIPSGDATP
jgi:hypothetical protein